MTPPLATASDVAASAAESPCLHCGLEIPSGTRARRGDEFCCAGCASVHALLHESGLQDFYRIREAGGLIRPAAPAASRAARFGFLDDPEFFGEEGAIPREMEFFLDGIHCSACVWLIEKLPVIEPSVERARVDLGRGVASVRVREGSGFARAAEALHAIGYAPYPLRNRADAEAARKRENVTWLKRIGVAAASTGNIMILAIAIYSGLDGRMAEVFRWVSLVLAVPALTYSAMPFYRGAMGALRSRRLSIDVPLALAIAVGGAVGAWDVVTGRGEPYFDTLTMLVFLMLVSRYALRRIQQRMLSPASSAGFHQPTRARRIDPRTGIAEEVYSHRLRPGDRVEVAPGERLPADGTVASSAWLDESLLTGESTPRRRFPGQAAYAGTTNLEAPLLLDVTSTGAETRVGRILDKVERNLASRSRSVELADRLSRVFVGAVILGAGGLFAALAAAGHPEAGSRALALVIVTCPCALALATPLTMSLTLARAVREGIWARDAAAVEALAEVDTVYFDKTGTLTEGDFRVLSWEIAPGEDRAAVERAALALEEASRHPVALAVARELRDRVTEQAKVEGFETVPGRGVRGRVGGAVWEARAEQETEGSVTEGARESRGPVTRIAFYRDGRRVARAELGDRVRAESAGAVGALARAGYDCRVLSGDGREACLAVASRLGLPEGAVASSQSPEDKERALRARPRAAMVGDGANDAAALSAASVGLAVRGSMEASLRAAPVYLAGGIAQVPRALAMARRTLGVLRANLAISIAYNLLGATGAALGWVSPLTAAILMPLSSLTVLLVASKGVRA